MSLRGPWRFKLTYPKPNFLTLGQYIKWFPKKFNMLFPGSLERWARKNKMEEKPTGSQNFLELIL